MLLIQLVKQVIIAAAIAHSVSAAGMLGVAECESSFNPQATNGRYIGLYQLGSPGELDNFYSRGYDNPFDPAQQANFFAERASENILFPWTCRYRYYTG